MKAKKTNPILEELLVVLRPPDEDGDRAAFVTDPAYPKSLEKAKEWAKWWGGPEPEVIRVPGVEVPWVEVVSCESRGEGGRAWKVMTPEGWYVDLREDVFFDVFFKGDFTKGENGIVFPGPFRWVRNVTQVRLALVDSDLYREIEAKAKKGGV